MKEIEVSSIGVPVRPVEFTNGRGFRASLTANLRLIRPADSAIAFLATLIGARLGAVGLSLPWIGVVALSNLLLVAGSASFNDWFDIQEDSINKPDAPVPSGRLSPRHALVLGCALLLAAVVLASAAGWRLGLLAIGFVCASVGYTVRRWKGTPFLGNLLVAVLSSHALWCWMVVVGFLRMPYALLSAGCILLCLGRELFGMSRDRAGDAASGIPTVAVRFGAAGANRIGVSILVVAALLAALPVLWHQVNGIYVGAFAGSWLLLLGLIGRVFGSRSDQDRRFSARLVAVCRVITFVMALGYAFGVRPV